MEFKLNELADIKNGKKWTEKNGGVNPVIGSNGLIGYSNFSNFKKGTVVVGRVGANCGSVHYCKEESWLTDNTIGVIPKNSVDNYYLYYFLKLMGLNRYAGGSAQPLITQKSLNELRIKIPPLKIQRNISRLLKTIDSKVELNNLLIANLEELSQTLFKHWFVDFEFPDENGNPYKSSGGEMVESELGEIPKGWEVKELKDIVKQKKETFNPQKADVLEALHFSLPAFDNGQTPVLDNTKTIKSNKWIITENCCLFSKMNPKTPRIWLPQVSKQYLNIASSEFVVLESDNILKNSFVYNVCQSKGFNEYLVTNTTGSTNSRQRVKPQVAMKYQLPFNEKLIEKYGGKIASISEKIINVRNENENLTKLRDTLLPKLMSGELEIPDDMEVDEDEL